MNTEINITETETETKPKDEYTKPKYKNLLSYLHSRNHYKHINKINDDNKDEILSNFILIQNKKCDGGKCFCGKKLKNVFYIYCILNNELLESGGTCKSLFNNKKETKERFNNNFIRKFGDGLGFEAIINWNGYIEKVMREFLNTNTQKQLQKLKELYKDFDRTLSIIDEYIEVKDCKCNGCKARLYIEEEKKVMCEKIYGDGKTYCYRTLRELHCLYADGKHSGFYQTLRYYYPHLDDIGGVNTTIKLIEKCKCDECKSHRLRRFKSIVNI